MKNNKYKLKHFIDCYVPVHLCNFRCHYCYILQNKLFDNTIEGPDHSADEFGDALSIKRTKGICLINFCGGGETLAMPHFISYAEAVLKQGHYIMIVTNGTLFDKYDEMAKWPEEYRRRTFFKFSYHFQQLKERGLLDRFFVNIVRMRNLGFSFTLELVPYDDLIPSIPEIKDYSIRYLGALPHVTVARDETKKSLPILTSLPLDKYYEIWSSFDSELFRFKYRIFGVKRLEYCYAGFNTCYLFLRNGQMQQCYCSGKNSNIYKKHLRFPGPVGNQCTESHCYNGHAWLCFGNIPKLETPTYFELRNRAGKFGNWVTPEMERIFIQKIDTNIIGAKLTSLKNNLALFAKRIYRCISK